MEKRDISEILEPSILLPESSGISEIKDVVTKRQKTSDGKNETQPPVPSKPKQCHFFVKRKKRYCHLTTREGFKFCGEHLNCLSEEEIQALESNRPPISKKNSYTVSGKRRIPCPFDTSHTIFEKDLEKHKTKCNARPPAETPKYISLDIHLDKETDSSSITTRLSEQPNSVIDTFLCNLKKEGTSLVPNFPTEIMDHSSLIKQKEKKTITKHANQQASLIGHLEKNGLLDPKNCFIEFGAGKGELSLYIYQALKSSHCSLSTPDSAISQDSPFVLIDRKNFRFKFDRYMKGNSEKEVESSTLFHRVTVDIKDLDLTKLDIIQNRPIVAFSKHLCGAATDLTLRSLSHFKQSGGKIAGVVIALCCHHACSSRSYVGHDYLIKNNMLSNTNQFGWLASMGSWATCGLRDNVGSHKQEDQEEPTESAHFTGLLHKEREYLGYTAKRVIDLGRLDFTRNMLGLNSKLVHYVSKELSLENLALVAFPEKIE